MTDHVLLSTRYFNITGKRRQDSADTLRMLASIQTHSGEKAGFYAVSEASGPGPMGSRARRLVLDTMLGEFTSRFDLPPAARLKAAVLAAQEELVTEFAGHVRVGITVLVSQESSVYLLQVPPAQAFVLQDGNLHSVAPQGTPEASGFAAALGSEDAPNISLFRDTMEPEDAIVLCSSLFARELQPEDLRDAFAVVNPEDIKNKLLMQARRLQVSDASCIVVEAVPAEEPRSMVQSEPAPAPAAHGVWDYVDDAVGSLAYVWDCALAELKPPSSSRPSRGATVAASVATAEAPPATQAPPATETPPANEVPASTVAAQASTAIEELTVAVPEDNDDHEPVLEDIEPAASWDSSGNGRSDTATEELPLIVVQPPPEEEQQQPAAPCQSPEDRAIARSSELDEVNSFMQSTLNLSQASPPVQGFPDTTVAPERIYPASGGQPARSSRTIGDVGVPSGERAAGTSRPLRARLQGLDSATRRTVALPSVPPAMWLWSAVGVGLVIVLIAAYFLFVGGSGPNYAADAKASANAAYLDFTQHKPGTNHQLSLAWSDIHLAQKQHEPPQNVSQAITYIQSQIDRMGHIFRLTKASVATVTRIGSADAVPTQITTGAPDLLVLDIHGERIYLIDPTKPNANPQPIVHDGDIVSTVRWGPPTQLTSNGNEVLGLDGHYNLFSYEPNQIANSLQPLTAPSSSARIVASTTYAYNYYLLDTKAGQVWKYIGLGNNYYSNPPIGYLTAPEPSQLSRAVSLAIANDGVYIARSDGKLLKFRNNKPVPFSVRIPIRFQHATQVYARDGLSYIFLYNAASGKIVELNQNGTYARTVIIPHSLLPGLQQMTVSADGKTIYFLSGRTLYSIPVIPA